MNIFVRKSALNVVEVYQQIDALHRETYFFLYRMDTLVLQESGFFSSHRLSIRHRHYFTDVSQLINYNDIPRWATAVAEEYLTKHPITAKLST